MDTPSAPSLNAGSLPESTLINEAQLLLAEKRTSLSTMRTGIAVFALPLSVLSLLVATSKHYIFSDVFYLILPLLGLCLVLLVLGSYLAARSLIRIRRFDRMITELKRQHPRLRELIEDP